MLEGFEAVSGAGGGQVSWAEVVRQLEAKQRLAEVVSEALQRFQAAESGRVQQLRAAPPEDALPAERQHGVAVEVFTSFLRVRRRRAIAAKLLRLGGSMVAGAPVSRQGCCGPYHSAMLQERFPFSSSAESFSPAVKSAVCCLQSRTMWMQQKMEQDLVQRLWSALCVSPPYPADRCATTAPSDSGAGTD